MLRHSSLTSGRKLGATLSEHGAGLDHVCYFATPSIVEGDGERCQIVVAKYANVYVTGPDVAHWLAGQTSGQFFLFSFQRYVEGTNRISICGR